MGARPGSLVCCTEEEDQKEEKCCTEGEDQKEEKTRLGLDLII